MNTSLFARLNVEELKKITPPTLLGNSHLVAKGLNVIYGPSATFKSFYILNHSLQIAQTSTVIYLAAEGSSGIYPRVNAWCDYYKKTPGNIEFICREVNLLKEEEVKTLIHSLVSIKNIEMVVLDTYPRCIPGGDESSSTVAGIAINSCAEIQRNLKCAVTLIHHTNRAESGERGSGALRGGADSMIEMNVSNGVIKVMHSKMKDFEEWPTESYKFLSILTSGVLISTDSSDAIDGKLSKQELDILELLALETFIDHGAKSLQIINATKIAESVVYKVLSSLKSKGFIAQGKRGDPYFLTSLGREALLAVYPTLKIKFESSPSDPDEDKGKKKPNSQTLVN